MALPTLEKDISYISKLADQPNDTTGSNLSAADLKARFDAAGEDIKAYLNSVLLPALETAIAAAAEGVAGDAQIGTDKISDNAITASKLAASAVVTNAIANLAVATAKLADKAVTEAKIAEKSVSANKIADAAVTHEKMANGAVRTVHIYGGSVSTEKIADAAVSTSKLANSSVIPIKLDRSYAELDENEKVAATQASSNIKIISSAEYTLVAEDAGQFLLFENSCSITIPADENFETFPISTEIELYKQKQANTLFVRFDGADNKFRTTDGAATSLSPYGVYPVIVLKRISATDWVAKGDIE